MSAKIIGLSVLQLIGDIGSPLTDNILTLGADGKQGFSIGPNMGFGAWQLNPWMQVAR